MIEPQIIIKSVCSPDWYTLSKPVYSLRMMSMARGGKLLQLGSIVWLVPLFILTEFHKCNFKLSLSSCLQPRMLGKKMLGLPSPKTQKSVIKLSTEGYLAPAHPWDTCCNVRTRLLPAVIGQRIVCKITPPIVVDVKSPLQFNLVTNMLHNFFFFFCDNNQFIVVICGPRSGQLLGSVCCVCGQITPLHDSLRVTRRTRFSCLMCHFKARGWTTKCFCRETKWT